MKKIRIVSPAKAIDKDCIEHAVDWLSANNFDVEISEHALGRTNYFSGSDEERLTDLQNAMDDSSVDFILCSRGGYGSVRIVDQLDFAKFSSNPKPIIGYSDITVFHNHIHTNYDIQTVHATAPLNFKENTQESLHSLLNYLNGESNKYEILSNELNRLGKVKAMVVGGNLSILASLIGTNSDLDTNGKILFIEEIGEAVYSVDRMMWSLKKAGKLAGLSGLIVGGMSNMKDSEVPFGKSVKEVIRESVNEYNFPVCFDFPAGHIDDNRTIILGAEASLSVSEDNVLFEQ